MGNVLIKFKWLENPVNPPVIFSVLVLVAANLAHVNNTEKRRIAAIQRMHSN